MHSKNKQCFKVYTLNLKKSPDFYFLLVLFLGTVLKNILLRAFISGKNAYSLNIIQALTDFLPALILNTAVTAFIFSFIFLFKRKGRFIYALTADIVVTALAFIDVMYYRSFSSLPSVYMLTLVSHLSDTKSNFFSWISPWDLLFLIDFFILLLIRIFSKNNFKVRGNKRSIKKWAITSLTAAFVLAFIPVVYLLGGLTSIFKKVYDPAYISDQALYFTSPGYHAVDIINVLILGKSGNVLVNEDFDQIKSFYKWNNEKLPENEYFGSLKGKNVLVIQVESLENFVIGKKISGEEITPNLNSMLSSSYYFPNIYEQVKCGNSSDCDFMFMTSVLPPDNVSVFNFYSDRSFKTLPDILRTKGYYSAYYNASTESIWNYEPIITGMMGFDTYRGDYKRDSKDIFNNYLSDESMLNQVLAKIKDDSRYNGSFYTHIVLCSSHTPFDASGLEDTLKTPAALKDNIMMGYLNLVHYVDSQIGTFLDNLKKAGLLDNTVVVIYGDHSGIHKYFPDYTDELSQIKGYEWLGNSETDTLPYIIYDPSGQTKELESDITGGQIDMLPTLLSLLGIEKSAYSDTVMGKNLLNTKRSFAVLPDGTVIGVNESQKDYNIIYRMFDTADLIISSDYFKDKTAIKN